MRKGFKKRRIGQRVTRGIATQDGGEIEAKTVDVEFRDPVVQTIEDEGADNGMVAVKGVSAAGVVGVGPILVQHVVGLVIDSPEGDRRTPLVSLGGMIKDHVEDHRDAGDM